jgi:hypothetical protein
LLDFLTNSEQALATTNLTPYAGMPYKKLPNKCAEFTQERLSLREFLNSFAYIFVAHFVVESGLVNVRGGLLRNQWFVFDHQCDGRDGAMLFVSFVRMTTSRSRCV